MSQPGAAASCLQLILALVDLPSRAHSCGTPAASVMQSCICHGCPWAQLQVNDGTNKTSYQHYAEWMAGKTTGAASMHIDTRLPNGGGTLVGSEWARCKAFPGTLAPEDRSIL
jgi:hypothetical protein|eukprot:COSAG02_NODE_747_length_17723_cov_49.509816_14_plen_113_part_00